MSTREPSSSLIGALIDGVIRFCLENKLVVFLVLIAVIGWGVVVMPFDYEVPGLPRYPVPVDAIPDIGENQQIVFTPWMGRSPQDVEDQITYPLTVSLLGVPGVKTIRSYSYLGFSSIYVVFEEHVEFYWSRSRILERLNVAQKELPVGVTPTSLVTRGPSSESSRPSNSFSDRPCMDGSMSTMAVSVIDFSTLIACAHAQPIGPSPTTMTRSFSIQCRPT